MTVKQSTAVVVLLVMIVYFSLINADSDEIFTVSTGVFFGRSSREPKFRIEFHSPTSPFQPGNDQESMLMANKDGQKYMCFLPVLEETKTLKSVTPHNSSSVIVESDRTHKFKTPDELMDVLQDKCFYRHEGWWTYEFCYQKKLRQLHLQDDKVVQQFVLGEFDPEATAAFNQKRSDSSILKDPRSKDSSQRYHAHLYTNGTTCDLTEQPRETEVRFVCSDHAVMISSITEIATCKYVVTIQCPILCKHPMFQQERPSWYTIHCNEIPRDASEPSNDVRLKGNQIVPVTDEDDDLERFAT